jgi:hypothetical protein
MILMSQLLHRSCHIIACKGYYVVHHMCGRDDCSSFKLAAASSVYKYVFDLTTQRAFFCYYTLFYVYCLCIYANCSPFLFGRDLSTTMSMMRWWPLDDAGSLYMQDRLHLALLLSCCGLQLAMFIFFFGKRKLERNGELTIYLSKICAVASKPCTCLLLLLYLPSHTFNAFFK